MCVCGIDVEYFVVDVDGERIGVLSPLCEILKYLGFAFCVGFFLCEKIYISVHTTIYGFIDLR